MSHLDGKLISRKSTREVILNEEIIKGIADWFSVPVVLVALVPVALGLVWLCWRTRSPSLLLERTWRILVGPSCSADREAGAILREHQELLEIRFKHVPRLRTHKQLLNLKGWLTANDEDIGDVGRCGDFFDPEQLRVRVEHMPRAWLKLIGFLLLCPTLWAGMASLTFSFGSKPILQLKATETWFVLHKDSVAALLSKETLSKIQCAATEPPAAAGFTKAERKTLCELLASPESVQHFENGVPLQRIALATLAGMLGFVGFLLYQWLRRARAAKELHARLLQRSTAASLLPACPY